MANLESIGRKLFLKDSVSSLRFIITKGGLNLKKKKSKFNLGAVNFPNFLVNFLCLL